MKKLINNFSCFVFFLLFHAADLLSQGNYFALVEQDSLNSFIDTSGKRVLGPFKHALFFSEGTAFVRTDSVEGYINSKGQFQIRLGEEFLGGDEFHEGMAAVFFSHKLIGGYDYKPLTKEHPFPESVKRKPEDTVTYGKNSSHGYIDQGGKMVIRAAYDAAGEFKEGMARVCNGCHLGDMYFNFKGGKFGFIDHSGKVIVPFVYDFAGNFSEGLALVEKDSLFGFIDHRGKVVIPLKYISATGFHSDRAFVERKKGVSILINKKGKCIRKIPGLVKCGYFNEEVCQVMINDSLINPAKKGWHVILIDRSGNTVAETDCDYILSFSEGLAVANKNKKSGFIDKKGQWAISPLFESVRDFSHGLAAAKLNGKWGYIDKKGNWKIQPVYDSAYEFVKAD